MTLLFIYLAIAIGVSFLCSILEAVLLSVTAGFIEITKQSNEQGGAVLAQVKDKLDESISGILILNTFAHTMGAAGVGAQASKLFGSQWEGVIAFFLTLAILYLSEIIPKTLGANYWRQLAIPAARVIRLMTKILYPLVWFSAKLTQLLKRKQQGGVSREEIAAMATLSHRGGRLGSQETELLNSVLQLREATTEDIATPRSVVASIDGNKLITEAIEELAESPFTRIPVFHGDIDHVLGIVTYRQLLEAERIGNGEQVVKSIVQPVHRVSELLPVIKLVDLFLKRREHLFIVEDKFGQTQAVVTLEDAIETVLGREIMDENDKVEDLQEYAKAQYRTRKNSDKSPE